MIEDDQQIGEALSIALKDRSYAVDWFQDGELGLEATRTDSFSLILLDLGLPKVDGLVILREVRDQKNNIPIIIMTAKDQVEDRIKGLDLGADDYLVKPFSVDELLARLRALIRRTSGSESSILESGDLILDLNSCKVKKSGVIHDLSQKEFALLRLFISNSDKIYSKGELEEKLYSWDQEISSNAVEFNIHALRKKLGKDIIQNIRGLGWKIKKD